MSQDVNVHQSLQTITISYLQEISDLKKEISTLQLEVERKENELAKAKLKIGNLEDLLK